MCVTIAFEKVASSVLKRVVKGIAGPYVHTEILVSTEADGCRSYSAFMGRKFSCQPLDSSRINDDTYDFLMLPVTPEEEACIKITLDACVKCKIPYNTVDMILSQAPMRQPTDRSLFESAPSGLYCAQAAVATLRECLMPPSTILVSLSGLNSRTVTPSELFNALRPHSQMVYAVVASLPKCDLRSVKAALQTLWVKNEN